jgi:poly(hydroxyalkanoate) granule-associated protein
MLAERVQDVPQTVFGAVRSLWYAGLGIVAVAQAQGSRVAETSAGVFSALIEKGEEMQADGTARLDRVKEVGRSAQAAWERAQAMVDRQVDSALRRLGVPTKGEIVTLADRIERLSASIEALKARS